MPALHTSYAQKMPVLQGLYLLREADFMRLSEAARGPTTSGELAACARVVERKLEAGDANQAISATVLRTGRCYAGETWTAPRRRSITTPVQTVARASNPRSALRAKCSARPQSGAVQTAGSSSGGTLGANGQSTRRPRSFEAPRGRALCARPYNVGRASRLAVSTDSPSALE